MSPLPDIGISTGAYARLPLHSALRRIGRLATAVEVRSFGVHSLLIRDNMRSVAASGLPVTVHGPFLDVDISAPDPAARQAALDEHRRHIAAAAELKASLYIVHPDWSPSARTPDTAVTAALKHSFGELVRMQADAGIPIVVENMPGVRCTQLACPGDLDLQGLGLLLDAGHAAISGSLDAWLADPCAELRHVHLHDNNGLGDGDDPHRALGTGVVDAAAVMAVARAAGASVVLEHYNEPDVIASLEHLRSLDLV